MLDLTKKYRTRDGRDVIRIDQTSSKAYPLCGIIENPDGTREPSNWNVDGLYFNDGAVHENDLMETVEPEAPDAEQWYSEYRQRAEAREFKPAKTPEEATVYFNFHRADPGYGRSVVWSSRSFGTRKDADASEAGHASQRIACVRVTYHEGRFDD